MKPRFHMLKVVQPKKLTIVLLISVLMMMSMGSAFGFVICDHGCLSKTHHENHHAGEESDNPAPLPYYPLGDEEDDSCNDYLLHFDNGCLEDKFNVDFLSNMMPLAHFPTFIPAPQNVNSIHIDQLFTSVVPNALLSHRITVLII